MKCESFLRQRWSILLEVSGYTTGGSWVAEIRSSVKVGMITALTDVSDRKACHCFQEAVLVEVARCIESQTTTHERPLASRSDDRSALEMIRPLLRWISRLSTFLADRDDPEYSFSASCGDFVQVEITDCSLNSLLRCHLEKPASTPISINSLSRAKVPKTTHSNILVSPLTTAQHIVRLPPATITAVPKFNSAHRSTSSLRLN